MRTKSYKYTNKFFLLVAAIFLMVFLSSCGTTETTITPTPTLSPTLTVTYTPEPPTLTPEPGSEVEGDSLILPSATPGPTVTPGVITEFVGEFSKSRGFSEKTVFSISMEDWLNVGISVVIILFTGFLLSRLVIYLLKVAAARTKTKYDDLFIEQIRSQIVLIIFVMGFQFGTLRLPFIDVMIKQWLNQLYIAIYLIAATVILWRLLDLLVEWYETEVEPQRDANQVDTLLILFHRAGRVMLISISGIMLLSLYNINVNVLIASLGVMGLGISLAAQDTLSNVIAGVMIMIDQPFRVGDRIEIQGLATWGDVVDIGLRSTRIRTRDNRLVIVPNNNISTDQVINYTYPDPEYRIQIEIGVGYGQDIEKVRQIIIDSVSQVNGVLLDKPVDALYVEMGASAMTFRVRWWIDSYVDTRRMFDSVNTALQKALDEAGIEMPFNTYDINILNMPGSLDDGNRDGDR